jgi:hypothetical protein
VIDPQQAAREPAQREEGDRRPVGQALRRRDGRVARYARGELFHQPRLAGAGGRGNRDELRPPLAECALRGQPELGEVVLAAEERRLQAPARRALEQHRSNHGLALSLDLDPLACGEAKSGDRAQGPFADQDRARIGLLLQARRDVDRIAGDEKIAAIARARGDDLAGVHADAQFERRSIRVARDRIAQAERRGERTLGVVAVRLRHAEDRHDRIADELLHRSAVRVDHFARDRVVAAEHRAHVLRVAGFS